nr:dihydrofolate reductase [uncultured Niameybacter sp.]
MISMIVAMSQNRVIGKLGKMPWNIAEDLQYFKALTTGHTIIMGRKTFESIGRPLPNRLNVVLTQDENYRAKGCHIVHSIEEIMEKYYNEDEELFIIGGSTLYSAFMPYAKRLYITLIEAVVEGDTYFPSFPIGSEDKDGFVCTKEIAAKQSCEFKYTFTQWERMNKIIAK